MSITPERYMHKPMEALRVTEENIEEVAAWCNGEVKTNQSSVAGIKSELYGVRYIELNVIHPTGRRRAKAFVGDWIVSARTSFKVYNNRAFANTFKTFPLDEEIQLVLSMMITNVMGMAFSEELSSDQKTAELLRIIEESSSGVLDLF
jgi:hypothetical protein